MSMNTKAASLKRLKDVLAAYGGDPSCWPADERGSLLALIGGNAEAGGMREEARALDRVLDSAAPPNPSDKLRGRILHAAIPAAPAGAVVIPMPQPVQSRKYSPSPQPLLNWPAAALLAASLLIGVWIGAGGIGSPLVSETLDIASLNSADDSYNYDIGLSDAEELL